MKKWWCVLFHYQTRAKGDEKIENRKGVRRKQLKRRWSDIIWIYKAQSKVTVCPKECMGIQIIFLIDKIKPAKAVGILSHIFWKEPMFYWLLTDTSIDTYFWWLCFIAPLGTDQSTSYTTNNINYRKGGHVRWKHRRSFTFYFFLQRIIITWASEFYFCITEIIN